MTDSILYFVVTMSMGGRLQPSIYHDDPPRVNRDRTHLSTGDRLIFGPTEVPDKWREMGPEDLMKLFMASDG